MDRRIKTIILLAFLVIGLIIGWPKSSDAASGIPELVAEAAVLIDARTGVILYEKNMDKLMEPASTTKIITCLLALDHLQPGQIVTVDAESSVTEGSRMNLVEDEMIAVEYLLYALMLESANDAATALAKEISGSVEAFAELMNELAEELGTDRSSFKNASGLPASGHLSTAYDLAIITQYAMLNPDFRRIISTVEYTIPATNKQPERIARNTNRMLADDETNVSVQGIMTPVLYEGISGVKTGFTNNAGACLVASAERDGTELIAVVLKSAELARYGDMIALLDYGFENYYSHRAVSAGTALDNIKVKRGAVNNVGIKVLEDRYITLPKEASTALINTRVVMDEDITAPVGEGMEVGKMEIYEGDVLIGYVPIVTTAAVDEGGPLSVFGIEDSTASILFKIVIALGAALLLFLLILIILRIKYARRRKARRKRRAYELARDREKKQRDLDLRRWPY